MLVFRCYSKFTKVEFSNGRSRIVNSGTDKQWKSADAAMLDLWVGNVLVLAKQIRSESTRLMLQASSVEVGV